MFELINSMVETEAELIDIDDDEVGGDEIQVYEIEAEMMTNEQDEEADMLYQQLLIECLLNDEVAHHEIIEALQSYQLINKLILYKIHIK